MATTTGPSSTIFAVLAVFAAAGGFSLLWQVYLRVRRGGAEDEELVSRISNQVIDGAHGLLEEYRIEIEVAKRRIEDYQKQITELNRYLGAANERINRLETELRDGRGERASLQGELRGAIEKRETMRIQVEELERQVRALQLELHGT